VQSSQRLNLHWEGKFQRLDVTSRTQAAPSKIPPRAFGLGLHRFFWVEFDFYDLFGTWILGSDSFLSSQESAAHQLAKKPTGTLMLHLEAHEI
jgi:hypothetical protein